MLASEGGRVETGTGGGGDVGASTGGGVDGIGGGTD